MEEVRPRPRRRTAPPILRGLLLMVFLGNAPEKAFAVTALETMGELREAADAAFDTNHAMEAMRDLVGILALDAASPPETDRERAAKREEMVRRADGELAEIGARLTLEPADEWLSGGEQIVGKVRDLSRGKGPQPAVVLVMNYDAGKAVIADATIRFSFVDGAGKLTERVDTDAYGRAATVIRSVEMTDRPVLVRAMLVVSGRGWTRTFPDVRRDFTFALEDRTARLFAVERPARSDLADAAAISPLADAVSRGLSRTGLDIVPISGTVDPAALEPSGAGPTGIDPAPSADAASSAVPYLVLAISEYDEPRRLVNNGRSYDIFTVTVRTRIRILRSDGSVAVSRASIKSVGRGGTAESALESALASSRSAVERDLDGAAERIRRALD